MLFRSDQKLADLFYRPDFFVSLYGYEREQGGPYGHRNVFFTQRGGPIIYINRQRFARSRWAQKLGLPPQAGAREGEIPPELDGHYMRNGFNPKDKASAHWFFGHGMIHAFDLRDGTASYRNRYVRTLVADAIAAAVAYLTGGTPPETNTYFNGVFDVPAKPSVVISVDKDNVQAEIIDSGYWPASEFTGLD